MATKKLRHPRDIENMADRDLVNLVVEDIKSSDSHLSTRLGKYKEWYAQYRSLILPENVRPHGANLFVPYTFQLVETSVPKWFNALFGSKPYTTILPAGESSSEAMEKAKRFNNFIAYQLDQRIKIVSVGNEIFKSVAIYGTAITKQEWVVKKRTIKKKQQAKLFDSSPVPGAFEVVSTEVKIKDDPTIELVSIFNFRFDPTGTDIDSCRWCAEIKDVDVEQVLSKQDMGIYKLSKEASDYINGLKNGSAIEIKSGENTYAQADRKKKGIKIVEYYTDEYRVHVMDDRFVVMKQQNPYWHGRKPFTKWVAIGVPGEFNGISIPETVESLQEELNATRNQRIDNVSMAINRMWKALRGSNITESQLISRPNGLIWVDDMNDLEEITMDNVTENAYREEQEIKQDMDMASGVLDSIRGTSTDRRETATTASIMHQSGGDRFQYETTLLDVTGLVDAVSQILALDQQFITEDKYMNLQGKDEGITQIRVSPTDLMGNFDVVAASRSTDPTANKEVQRNQLISLQQTLAQSPYVNQMELTKRILESFDLKNIDALLQNPMPQGLDQQNTLQGNMQTGMMGLSNQNLQTQSQNPLDTATPDQIQMVLNAIETGGELPAELIPLAQALVKAMEAESGGQM